MLFQTHRWSQEGIPDRKKIVSDMDGNNQTNLENSESPVEADR